MITWDPIANILLLFEKNFRLDYRGSDVAAIYRRENLAEWLDEKDREHDQALLSAIEQFSKTGYWPELTREQSLLMHMRVVNALSLLSLLGSTVQGRILACPAEGMPPAIHLLWLLDTVWRHHRQQAIEQAAKDMLKP